MVALGAALRGARVLHGDVVPHNFLVDPADGRLRLIDFGRARVLAGAGPGDGAGRRDLERERAAFEAVAEQLCDPAALRAYLARQLPDARRGAPARAATARRDRARH